MLLRIQQYFAKLKPVIIDGTIAVTVAMLIALQTYLSNDDIYKYMNAYIVFYMKMTIGTIAAGATALQYFRSKAYADHKKQQEKETNEKNNNTDPTNHPSA